MQMISRDELARMIDHTNLRPDASGEDIEKLCREAETHNFRCVCVNPTNTVLAVDYLQGSDVGVCTVVGFPLGAVTPEIKAFEAKDAVDSGASEVDMVMNIGMFKSGEREEVARDIQGVVVASQGMTVKVILETALLTYREKVDACLIAKMSGVDFVKTSTGFGGLTGATVEDVTLLRETVGEDVGVKASGGIRDLAITLKMIHAGANRIGTSSSIQIIEAFND